MNSVTLEKGVFIGSIVIANIYCMDSVKRNLKLHRKTKRWEGLKVKDSGYVMASWV